MPVPANGLTAKPAPSAKETADLRWSRWMMAGFIGIPVVLIGIVSMFVWAAIDDDRTFVVRQTQRLKASEVSERMDAILELGGELSRNPKRADEIAAASPVLVEFLGDDTTFQWNTIHAGVSFPTGSVTTPAKESEKLLVRLGVLAVPALIDALNNYEWSDSNLSERMYNRLQELRLKKTDDPLNYLNEMGRRLRVGQQACQALVKIGYPARAPVVAALQDRRWAVRAGAAVTLAVFADRELSATLESALTDEDAYVREAVVLSLGRLAGPNAVSPLIAALHSELEHTPIDEGHLRVIKAAATTLATFKDARAIEPVITALEHTHGTLIGHDIQRALNQLVRETLPLEFPKRIDGTDVWSEPQKWRAWWNAREHASRQNP